MHGKRNFAVEKKGKKKSSPNLHFAIKPPLPFNQPELFIISAEHLKVVTAICCAQK